MKKLLLMLCAFTLLAACATPYKRAKKESANGYFDVKLQEGMYEVFFNGNENTTARRAHDLALLRACEVCLDNGYQSFDIVRRTEDYTEKEVDTGVTIFGGMLTSVENSEPKITLEVRCSKNLDLPYKAADLKTNLKERYKVK